jgi:hypothetical protein
MAFLPRNCDISFALLMDSRKVGVEPFVKITSMNVKAKKYNMNYEFFVR